MESTEKPTADTNKDLRVFKEELKKGMKYGRNS